MYRYVYRVIILFLAFVFFLQSDTGAQIPMDRILSRITIPSEGDMRGLVDLTGFPHTADQMDYIGNLCEGLEKDAIAKNHERFGFSDETGFICGISPHDDYILAGRVYSYIHRSIKAKTVILIGNAHWSEAFGIRNMLIFGDFRQWRGPYGPVTVSTLRQRIIAGLSDESYTVDRKLVETEHSLEGLVPFLQYYNRDVEIIPVLIPYTDWETMNKLGIELADAVAKVVQENGWELGRDIAVLCSMDGQHYGDYGWSYYDFHPFGTDAAGFIKATDLDKRLINDYLSGIARSDRVFGLFSELVDQDDISRYKITWCGRFSAPFAVNFSINLAKKAEGRELTGYLLRYGTSLSDQWLPVAEYGLGTTSDTNLHHFVTFAAMGFK
ncbi:AmmeMemoRadiSam system protein B [candidate division KSB1 bacterium]